jgi:hypothetical protein
MDRLFDFTIMLCLIGLNLYTIWFYQRQISVLVDKAMSRSYAEYVQTKNLEQADHYPKDGTQEIKEPNNDEVLKELNQLMLV